MATAAVVVVLAARSAGAQTPPAPVPPSPPSAQQQYERERKSPGLALTLETLCPISGAGTLYTGTEGEKAGFLAVLSGISAGAGVGSLLWLVHLDGEHASGGSRVALDVEQGAAISVLVTASLVYILARASGLSLASQSTEAFNQDLQRRLFVP